MVIPADLQDEGGSVAGVVLAAGSSRRTGGVEKLVVPVEGRAMVRRVAETALAAGLDPVLVVVGEGPRAEPVRQALGGLPVLLVTNRDAARGLASSLTRGVGALPRSVRAASVLLGDMPWVRPGTVRALTSTFDSASRAVPSAAQPGAPGHHDGDGERKATALRVACVPVYDGHRGNPVLWGAGFFPDILTLDGDRGARALLDRHPDAVREVEVDDPGVLRDVDTVDDLERLRREVPWPT